VADAAYLRRRYPSVALRASMAHEATVIAGKASARGNEVLAGLWYGVARDFRATLDGARP
jgi:hypothetical protein